MLVDQHLGEVGLAGISLLLVESEPGSLQESGVPLFETRISVYDCGA